MKSEEYNDLNFPENNHSREYTHKLLDTLYRNPIHSTFKRRDNDA